MAGPPGRVAALGGLVAALGYRVAAPCARPCELCRAPAPPVPRAPAPRAQPYAQMGSSPFQFLHHFFFVFHTLFFFISFQLMENTQKNIYIFFFHYPITQIILLKFIFFNFPLLVLHTIKLQTIVQHTFCFPMCYPPKHTIHTTHKILFYVYFSHNNSSNHTITNKTHACSVLIFIP